MKVYLKGEYTMLKKSMALILMSLILVGCGPKYSDEKMNESAAKYEIVMAEFKSINQSISRYMTEVGKMPSTYRMKQIQRNLNKIYPRRQANQRKQNQLKKTEIPFDDVLKWIYKNDQQQYPTLYGLGAALFDKSKKSKKSVDNNKYSVIKMIKNENQDIFKVVARCDKPKHFQMDYNYVLPYDGYGMVFVIHERGIQKRYPYKSDASEALKKDVIRHRKVMAPVDSIPEALYVFIASKDAFVLSDILPNIQESIQKKSKVLNLPAGFTYYTQVAGG